MKLVEPDLAQKLRVCMEHPIRNGSLSKGSGRGSREGSGRQPGKASSKKSERKSGKRSRKMSRRVFTKRCYMLKLKFGNV